MLCLPNDSFASQWFTRVFRFTVGPRYIALRRNALIQYIPMCTWSEVGLNEAGSVRRNAGNAEK